MKEERKALDNEALDRVNGGIASKAMMEKLIRVIKERGEQAPAKAEPRLIASIRG